MPSRLSEGARERTANVIAQLASVAVMGRLVRQAEVLRLAGTWFPWRLAAATPGLRNAVGFASFGPGSHLGLPRALINPAAMEIGAGVWIQPQAILEVIGRSTSIRLSIGDGCYLGYNVRIGALGSVKIGRSVAIGDRVYIGDTGHNYEDVDRPLIEQGFRKPKPVVIGDGAMIGVGALVLRGAEIGEGSFVGANSVVSSHVPPHSVAVGNPARVVRAYDGTQWRWTNPDPGPAPATQEAAGPQTE